MQTKLNLADPADPVLLQQVAQESQDITSSLMSMVNQFTDQAQ